MGRGLTLPQMMVMAALMAYVRPAWKYECRPSIDTIMAEANLGRTAVKSALAALEKKGFIKRIVVSKRQANRYEIVLTPKCNSDLSGSRDDLLSGSRDDHEVEEEYVERDSSNLHTPLDSLAANSKGAPLMSDKRLRAMGLRPASEGQQEPTVWEFAHGLAPGVSDKLRSRLVREFTQDEAIIRRWFKEGKGLLKSMRSASSSPLDEWQPEQLWAYWRRLLQMQWPRDFKEKVPRNQKFEEIGCVSQSIKRRGAEVTKKIIDALVTDWDGVRADQTWITNAHPYTGLLSGEKAGPNLEKYVTDGVEAVAAMTAEEAEAIRAQSMREILERRKKS